MTLAIGVVDYGAGNVLNVLRAFVAVGFEATLISEEHHLRQMDVTVIPGVGSFDAGMRGLRHNGLDLVIKEMVELQKPILGICLGMQLLATTSEESPGVEGLNLIPGDVQLIGAESSNLSLGRVPQTGWNSTTFQCPFGDFPVGDQVDFYYSHSYRFQPQVATVVLATKTSADDVFIPSVIQQNFVTGAQFHPEKSGANGLLFLSEWVRQNMA